MTTKLNLNDYPDKEILSAFMKLEAMKFFRVMNGLVAISAKMQKRGAVIAREMGDEEVDEIIRRLENPNES